MRYLIRKKKAKSNDKIKSHIWQGKDTACRMASTGGLVMRYYEVTNFLRDDNGICKNCIKNILLAKQGKGHNSRRRKRWIKKKESEHGLGGNSADRAADDFMRKHGGW